MNLVDLEFHLVERPTIAGPPLRSLLVRLLTDRGVEGWGETSPIYRASELAARRDYLLPMLGDRSLFDLEELLGLEALEAPALRSALDMACWDAIGRALDQPLCRLWGGVYRPRIPLAARLPEQPPPAAARLAREWVEQGCTTMIVSLSGDIEADLFRLEVVRDAVGPRVALRVDAGGAFQLDDARRLGERLADENVPFLIDPLAALDFGPLAELEQFVTPPLAVSRWVKGPADVLAAARAMRMPRVVVDLARVGGPTTARKCAVVAEAAGIAMNCGGGAGLGLATAAMLHLAAATPHLSSPQESAVYWTPEPLLVEPLIAEGGWLAVPQGPGLGIEVDRARLEQFAVRD